MNKEINRQLDTVLRRLDSQTYNHSVRVMLIAAEVEKYIGASDHMLMNAALFHDIGKIYIPFNILDKLERLSSLEREIIDLHPYFGYKVLSNLGVNEDMCRLVLYHHSFRPITLYDVGYYDNNSVYENALRLHTIDAFEALTSDRPYHRGLPSIEAIQILSREGNYDDVAMQYITEVAYKEDMSASVINRANHDRDLCVSNLIMGMELQNENRS